MVVVAVAVRVALAVGVVVALAVGLGEAVALAVGVGPDGVGVMVGVAVAPEGVGVPVGGREQLVFTTSPGAVGGDARSPRSQPSLPNATILPSVFWTATDMAVAGLREARPFVATSTKPTDFRLRSY